MVIYLIYLNYLRVKLFVNNNNNKKNSKKENNTLIDSFTGFYGGSSVSSTEKDIDTRLTKAWTAINRLSIIWKYIIENGQNTEKSPGNLGRLAVTQTPVKNHHITLI